MSDKKVARPVALAVGAALAGSFALAGTANAETGTSPFAMSALSAGYMLGAGEGGCGADKQAQAGDPQAKDAKGDKGAEGSCGGDKAKGAMGEKGAEGSCGGDKAKGEMGAKGDKPKDEMGDKGAEGSCGGDKESMPEDKMAEGKCGEGKCGGDSQ